MSSAECSIERDSIEGSSWDNFFMLARPPHVLHARALRAHLSEAPGFLTGSHGCELSSGEPITNQSLRDPLVHFPITTSTAIALL